ncbi:MAG: DUF131 domain-containing protein [Candidatus Bathyarchaeia archaeon]
MNSVNLALDAGSLYSIGLIMILLGVIVIFAAFALLFISSIKGGKMRGGGALIIGPFPIVFGTDREFMKTMLWLSIVLTLIAFALFLTVYLLGR